MHSIATMDFNSEMLSRLNVIKAWVVENKIGSNSKNVDNIVKELFWSCFENNVTDADIGHLRHKLRTDEFKIGEGNVWSALRDYFGMDKYVKFFADVAELTPNGLNTSPNACCGKFELFYRLLRPASQQPSRGDIVDGGVKIEIKGKTGDDGGVRISSTELTGKVYRANCDSVFSGSSITPNDVKKGGMKNSKVFEIEKTQHRAHYKKEFERDLTASRQLTRSYLAKNGWGFAESDIELIHANGQWNQDELQRLTLKKMFAEYKAKSGFDKMYIFGDGTNVKIIEQEADLNKVAIVADYFRINQTGNVGWYIS